MQSRIDSNTSEGVLATGTLISSAAIEQVQFEDDVATVTDCVRNDLAWTNEDGSIVEAATGHRRPLLTTLERTGEDEWQVVDFDDPGIRGPLDLPVGLEEQLPDLSAVCVPHDVEVGDIEQAYLRYWDVVYEAGAPAGGGPANPDASELADVAAGQRLETLLEFLNEKRDEAVRITARSRHAPKVVAQVDGDSSFVVLDCPELVSGGSVDTETGEETPDEVGFRSLDRVVVDAETLQITNSLVVEEGGAACDAVNLW